MVTDLNSQLSVMYVRQYNDAKGQGKTYIPCGSVASHVMIAVYDRFVKDGSIKPIEDLSKEQKEELVKECRETGSSYTNETLINSAKILHLIKEIGLYT